MQLLKEISERTYLINVNSKGNVISSEDLAEKFSELALAGQSDVTFIIGENELSKEIIDKTSYCLAISKFDIDVSVLTVILFEQIYRAYRINKGEPYHK
jgi:23S rRNA (pseudouridine1915-N3)-methyltransferase